MIITIASGKGGAGKTFVACALARELAKNHRVLLVDADCECANARIFFSGAKLKEEKGVKTFFPEVEKKLCNRCGACTRACRANAIFPAKDGYPVILHELCNSCGACFIACTQNALKKRFREIGKIREFEISSHFSLLEGELFSGERESMPLLRELWKRAEKILGEVDFAVIDSPPGVRCASLFCMEKSDLVLLVAEASEFGMSDALRTAKACRFLQKNFFVVLNKVSKGSSEFPEREKIVKRIPFSREILESCAKGTLPEREKIKALAEFVVGLNEENSGG